MPGGPLAYLDVFMASLKYLIEFAAYSSAILLLPAIFLASKTILHATDGEDKELNTCWKKLFIVWVILFVVQIVVQIHAFLVGWGVLY